MSSKLSSIAKQQSKKTDEEDDSKYSWLDDYLASKDSGKEKEEKDAWWKKSASHEPSAHETAARSWWEDRKNEDDDEEDDTTSYGSYGGYSSGSYDGYGSAYSGYSTGRSYYAGGSNSIFSSRSASYSTTYGGSATDISNLREHLDIKSFVSNLMAIHDSSTKRHIIFQADTASGIGNILSPVTSNVPIMADVLLMDSSVKSFNERLDILSGQCLMTAVMSNSSVKTGITAATKGKISEYALKHAHAEKVSTLLKYIVSMLAEKMVEEDVIKNSPGYRNYITSFRDYYYAERLVTGVTKFKTLTALDIAYTAIRHPEKIQDVLDAAKTHIEPTDPTVYTDIVNTHTMLERIVDISDLTKDNIFEKAARTMMVILSAQSKIGVETPAEDVSGINESALQEVLERLEANKSLLGMMNKREMSEGESEVMSALERLENYDYSSYEAEDPVEKGLTHFKNFDVNFYTMKGDRDDYDIIKRGIDAYVGPLKRMMKFRDLTKKTTLTSQRRGTLDRGKLAIANSTDKIYKKTYVDIANSVSICLVVDESGSMGGPGIDAARALACLFSEAFMGSKTVELKIYGHSAQEESEGYGDENQVVIRRYPNKESISELRARYQNMDGIAMHAIAKDFLKVAKKDNKKIMIVLSDGNPWAYGYSGSAGVKHTKKCIDLIEGMGITPVQVAIASHVDCAEMFKRWFKFTNVSTFLPDMEKMVKNVLKRA